MNQTRNNTTRLKDEGSIAMQIAFGDGRPAPSMKLAVCISLYVLLVLLWLPALPKATPRAVPIKEPRPVARTLIIKPVVRPVPAQKRKDLIAKRPALQDQTFLHPAPNISALVLPDPNPRAVVTDDWEGQGLPQPPTHEDVVFVGMPGVEAPVFLTKPAPVYPKKGIAIRLQGYVILQAILRKDGSVDDIEVLRGLGRGKFGFEKEAIASLRQWQFIPGLLHGSPADVRMNLRVDFILN